MAQKVVIGKYVYEELNKLQGEDKLKGDWLIAMVTYMHFLEDHTLEPWR